MNDPLDDYTAALLQEMYVIQLLDYHNDLFLSAGTVNRKSYRFAQVRNIISNMLARIWLSRTGLG